MKTKHRTYVVRLNKIYGLSCKADNRARVLSGVFITKNRCSSVIDQHGPFHAYQHLKPDSFFEVYLDGEWHDVKTEEAQEIMNRHWREDNL